MVSRRPEKVSVKDLIEKGGSAKNEKPDADFYLRLRIPAPLFKQLDLELKKSGINRTSWILDAIYEKLKE